MKSLFLSAISAVFALASVTTAQAATTLYFDRSSFEAALDQFTVDDYSDVQGGVTSTLVRPGYTLTGSVYECEFIGSCGDNSTVGFPELGYLWNYQEQTLSFDTAVNAVGMDFAYRNSGTTTLSIGDFTGPTTKNIAFFGIISDTTFTEISYNLSGGSSSLSDNLTFGTVGAPAVPVPASLPLLVAGFGAFAVMRRRKQAS